MHYDIRNTRYHSLEIVFVYYSAMNAPNLLSHLQLSFIPCWVDGHFNLDAYLVSYTLWLHAELSGPPVFDFNDYFTNCSQLQNTQFLEYFIIYLEDDFLHLVDIVNLQGAFPYLHWICMRSVWNFAFSDFVASGLHLDYMDYAITASPCDYYFNWIHQLPIHAL